MNARVAASLKARLLADPSLINAREAALRVIRARKKCSPVIAQYHLAQLEGADVMSALLKRVLPSRDFARMLRNPRLDLCDVLGFPWQHRWMLENYYEPDEEEHYTLDMMDIPIVALNPYYGSDEPQDELSLTFRLAGLLDRPEGSYGNVEHTQVDERLWAGFRRDFGLPADLRPAGVVSRPFFDWVFGNQRSPLRHLPLAIKVSEFDTGCIFLDWNPEWEGETGLDWSLNNVLWLRAQYKLAKRVFKNLGRLAKWLDAGPAERVARACRLYRKAQNLTRDEKQKAKSGDAHRTQVRALATVL